MREPLLRDMFADFFEREKTAVVAMDPFSAGLNITGNALRNSENPVIHKAYDAVSRNTMHHALAGTVTHPFASGVFGASPLSQILDPVLTAGDVGTGIRDLLSQVPPENRLAALQDIKANLTPEIIAKMPSEYRSGLRTLSQIPEEKILEQVAKTPTRKAVGPAAQRAYTFLGSLVGGMFPQPTVGQLSQSAVMGTNIPWVGKDVATFAVNRKMKKLEAERAAREAAEAAGETYVKKQPGFIKRQIQRFLGGLVDGATTPHAITEGGMVRRKIMGAASHLVSPAVRSAVEQIQTAADMARAARAQSGLDASVTGNVNDAWKEFKGQATQRVRQGQALLAGGSDAAVGALREHLPNVQEYVNAGVDNAADAGKQGIGVAKDLGHQEVDKVRQMGQNIQGAAVQNAMNDKIDEVTQKGLQAAERVRSAGSNVEGIGKIIGHDKEQMLNAALDDAGNVIRNTSQAAKDVGGLAAIAGKDVTDFAGQQVKNVADLGDEHLGKLQGLANMNADDLADMGKAYAKSQIADSPEELLRKILAGAENSNTRSRALADALVQFADEGAEHAVKPGIPWRIGRWFGKGLRKNEYNRLDLQDLADDFKVDNTAKHLHGQAEKQVMDAYNSVQKPLQEAHTAFVDAQDEINDMMEVGRRNVQTAKDEFGQMADSGRRAAQIAKDEARAFVEAERQGAQGVIKDIRGNANSLIEYGRQNLQQNVDDVLHGTRFDAVGKAFADNAVDSVKGSVNAMIDKPQQYVDRAANAVTGARAAANTTANTALTAADDVLAKTKAPGLLRRIGGFFADKFRRFR